MIEFQRAGSQVCRRAVPQVAVPRHIESRAGPIREEEHCCSRQYPPGVRTAPDAEISPVHLSTNAHAVRWPVHGHGLRIDSGYWADRQRANREASLPLGLAALEDGGNLHNLRLAAGWVQGEHRPTLTLDADVYKWVEAAAWELGRQPSEELRRQVDDVIRLIATAQQPDGYLNSWFQVVEPDRIFTDLTRGCEMYCAGHLIQAGIAMARATGSQELLDVGRRFADYLYDRFQPGARPGVDGHEEIEVALVELYRHTGDGRYLTLACHFLDQRGHGLVGTGVFGAEYYQDHLPVREAPTVTGHAVRAMYLACGATDAFLETGDATLLEAMERQWKSMVISKTYLTGGLGSRERDEAFGEPYELPPDRPYCETCAAVGGVMWNWRMLLATGDGAYADLMERMLYNAVAPGVSLDGEQYFYANSLHIRSSHIHFGGEWHWDGSFPWYTSPPPEHACNQRKPWYPCACCPPNVMRLLSSLGHYAATCTADGVQLHLYAGGTMQAQLAGGRSVTLQMATNYPWSGAIEVTVAESDDAPWALSVRIPGWCGRASLSCNGVPVQGKAAGGYVTVSRVWSSGDRLTLDLAMPPRVTTPDPRIDAVRGCAALERGPLVYCFEHVDQPRPIDLDSVTVPADAAPRLRPDGGPFPGVPVLEIDGVMNAEGAQGWPYTSGASVPLLAIPYSYWANREPGAMRVWIPRTD